MLNFCKHISKNQMQKVDDTCIDSDLILIELFFLAKYLKRNKVKID